MELKWRLMSTEPQDRNVFSCEQEKRHFELSFNTKFKIDQVLHEYLPSVLAQAKEEEEEGVKLYTRKCSFGSKESGSGGGGGGVWGSIN